MRVLHVIPAIAPRYGGPSVNALGYCRALIQAGVRAEIATTAGDGPGQRLDVPLGGFTDHGGVPTVFFETTWSETWKYSRGLGRWLRANAPRYDLFHVHAVFSSSTTAACRAARAAGVPTVLRPCGMLLPRALAKSRCRKKLAWWLLEARNHRRAAALHATSQEEAKGLRRLGLGRVAVVPVGVQDDAWQVPSGRERRRRAWGIEEGQPLVLFLGRLTRKKQVAEVLLPAVARLPGDVRLALVGAPDPRDRRYEREVDAAIRSLGLRDRVIIPGELAGADKWHAFDAADVFALPSRHENFAVTVIEAMARGLPVVITPNVQSAQYVLACRSGFVAQENPQAVADAISRLLADAAMRRSMGAAGRRYVHERLSWGTVVQELKRMYVDVLAGRELCDKTAPCTTAAATDA